MDVVSFGSNGYQSASATKGKTKRKGGIYGGIFQFKKTNIVKYQ